jgi:hypothetical protein
LWQLETWLRRMVYIELRALLGDDWHTRLVGSGADRARAADKQLSHMPTPEMDLLSYASFDRLCRIISKDWSCFKMYLPPKALWEVKLGEIKEIRNRVAHFRVGHKDDIHRVIQLLRDTDDGFWRFCTSYNNPHPILPPDDDPVVQRFIDLEQFPYSEIAPNHWAKFGIADPEAIFNLTIEVLRRPWQSQLQNNQIAGSAGYLYDVTIAARGGRELDYKRYLEDTVYLHPHFVHVCLGLFGSSIRITIPAILGHDLIIHLIDELNRWIPNALRRSSARPGLFDNNSELVEKLADQWPEYVLGPRNPLTFLDPDMPSSFFGV